MLLKLRNQRGLETVEMALTLVLVVGMLAALWGYLKGGFTGYVKQNADSYGTQHDATGGFTQQSGSVFSSVGNTQTSSSCSQFKHNIGADTGTAPTLVDCDPEGLPTPEPGTGG